MPTEQFRALDDPGQTEPAFPVRAAVCVAGIKAFAIIFDQEFNQRLTLADPHLKFLCLCMLDDIVNALLHDAVDAVLKFFRENVIDIINGAYQPEIVGISHFFEHIHDRAGQSQSIQVDRTQIINNIFDLIDGKG